jgi:signal transduction histidine kinase
VTFTVYSERRSEFKVYLRQETGVSMAFTRITPRRRNPLSLIYTLSHGRTEATPESFCSFFNACTADVITALRDSRGELVGFGKVTRDMTDIRARRAALEQANAELRHINQALEAFTRSMTHDISGPLRTIRGFSEIVLEDYGGRLDEEGQDYVRRIASGAQRLSHLIQSLVAFLRLTRAGDMPALERVSWDTVVADVIRDLQWDIDRRGAAIDVRGPLGEVLGYRQFLVMICANLLRNALKFVAPDVVPTITISSEKRNGLIRLIVEDNGIGIPAGDQQVIFEPFKRLHPHASFEGSGLGLAIVQHAVTRMGGSCGVESEVGQGSRFWIELRAPQ